MMYPQQPDRDQHISKKKHTYAVQPPLRAYLAFYNRAIELPVRYDDLLHFNGAIPVYDKHGKDTLWETALYDQSDMQQIHAGLKQIYSILKTEGDNRVHRHLQIERIDYCTFGNSNPFRIRIVNKLNDNYDYFYIKRADASRLYGLELEHILSPSDLNFFVDQQTLVEEHIAGIPGDVFISNYLENPEFNKVRIAKELVKFNERCFIRLLGDMRSYNYVWDITPDFEEVQFRIRAIDFDQQCYEGRKNLYLPQFFKENYPLVQLVQQRLSAENIEQYREEEQTLMTRRVRANRVRFDDLMRIMKEEELAPPGKVIQLRTELAAHYEDQVFLQCQTMGQIVRHSIERLLA